MTYKNWGRTGIQVSRLCMGTMNFGSRTEKPEAMKLIKKAIEAGINIFDTANAYNNGLSEQILGEGLKLTNSRKKIFLMSKVHHPMDIEDPNSRGISRRHIIEQCEESLKRLQTDYLDCYFVHRPDPLVPIDETLRALDDLVKSGKVRYIGTSTFPTWQIIESLWVSKEYGLNRFVVEQPPYNLLDRRIERELLPMAKSYGIAVMPWSPTARGFFTGKYRKSIPKDSRFNDEGKTPGEFGEWVKSHMNDRSLAVLDEVEKIAKEKNCTADQIALAWCMAQDGVTCPLIGPRTIEQFNSSIGALDITIAKEDEDRINRVSAPGEHIVSYYGAPLADFSSKKYSW